MSRGQLSHRKQCDRDMVDAIRECLGLDPLYRLDAATDRSGLADRLDHLDDGARHDGEK